MEAVHDTEIAMGTDIALFKHLPFLIIKKQRLIQQNHLENDRSEKSSSLAKEEMPEYVSIMEEISNTFTALEMVLRCSANSISTCFARIGPELFPILLESIQELSSELSKDTSNSNPTISILEADPKTVTEKTNVTTETTAADDDDKEESKQNQRDLDRASKTSTPTQSCDGSATSVTRLEPEAAATTTTAMQSSNSGPSSDTKAASKVTLKTCTKIIGHFARVGSLTETLANTPMLLDTLCDVISNDNDEMLNNDHASGSDNVPIEAKLNCLWIIANLACSAENMALISRHPKIKECLFEIISHPNRNEESQCQDINQFIRLLRTRSVAVRAIFNLSWSQDNKIPFCENIDLIESLLRIASHRKSQWAGSGKGVSGILLQSRRYACGTLRNLAAAPRKYKRRLCRLKSGNFLDILANIARHDHDSEVRDKIHATLFNLVSADTAKLFTEKRNVLDVITSAATAVEEKDDNDNSDVNANDRGSRKIAENTLRSLEKALPEDDEGYDALRPTLSRFDSQVGINRTNSNLGSVTISLTNLGALPSISNFSFGSISNANLNPESV